MSINPATVEYDPIETDDLLVDEREANQHLGLWDDQSMQPLVEQLLRMAHEYCEQWLGKPISGQAITCRYAQWDDVLRVPALWQPDAVLTAHYYDPSNRRVVAPAGSVLLDPTRAGDIVCTHEALRLPLSTLFGAPVEVRIEPTCTPKPEAVRTAIIKVINRLYSQGDYQNNVPDGSMRALVGDLLGTVTFAAVS